MIASMYSLSRKDFSILKLSDAYSIHRIIYNLFPKTLQKATKGFLFVDKGGSWNKKQILILSDSMPLQPVVGEIKSKAIPEHFLEQKFYGFEIRLNPTKRDILTNKTIALRDKQQLLSWFLQKMPQHGFLVDKNSLQVEKTGVQQFKKGNKIVTQSTATFKGKLKVVVRDLFKKSFKQGIGRARGFGFGLLQIVPIQIQQKEGF